tara:strand:+ start:3110 stop:3385 length:276 start_codon:yes stop_codon:yes gene_type:complete
MKKTVIGTNLTIRFYLKDSWSKEILDKYIVDRNLCRVENQTDLEGKMQYFTYSNLSFIDFDSLYSNEIGDVIRTFDDDPSLSDREYLSSFI